MFGSKTLKATLIGTSALVAVAFLATPTTARAACVTTVTGATTGPINLCAGTSLTISNTGTITSGKTGVSVNAVTGGSITNHGHITSAKEGIYINHTGSLTGSILNTGTISSTAPANATGIRVETHSSVAGAITNSGTIKSADSGIAVTSSSIGGAITNSGHITSTSASGIFITRTTVGGALVNSGTIQSSSTGIDISSSTISGDVVNTGSIHSGGDGIEVDGGAVSNGIINSGTIFSTGGKGSFGGIFVESANVTGGILNSGTINTTGGKTGAFGIGLESSSVSGGIRNTGTIKSGETGIRLEDTSTVTGGITNSGHITAVNDDGIRVESSSSVSGGITNTAAGIIHSEDAGIYVEDGSNVDFIHNAGTIESTDSKGIYVESSSVSGGIVNSGSIHSDETGIYLEEASVSGGIVNSGTINHVDDEGILVSDSLLAGGIVNSGKIIGEETGIEIDDGSVVSGGILNSGTISATDDAGITVFSASTISGGVTNSGTIVAEDEGIEVTRHSIIDGITNSGTIDARFDTGIFVESSTINGSITNTSTGKIFAHDSKGIELEVGTVVNGSITNAGTISSKDTGIELTGANTVTGGIVNSGTIIANGDAGLGIFGHNVISGGITNSGLISAYGYGIEFDTGTITGGITNSGTIIAGDDEEGIALFDAAQVDFITNSGTIRSDEYGIEVDTGTVTGAITNSGTIHTTFDEGIGIFGAGSHVGGGIFNSGLISSEDSGIEISQATVAGGITNSGTIITRDDPGIGIYTAAVVDFVTNSGKIQSWESGILVRSSTLTGAITNSGTITSTDDAGIDVLTGAVTGGIILQPGGVIQGGDGTGIELSGLTGLTPITLNGGTIIGDVTDSAPNNGFSPVTVAGTFATDGNFTVSDLVLPAAGHLTISPNNTFTTSAMTGGAGTLTFGVSDALSFGALSVVNGNAINLAGTTVTVDAAHEHGLVSGDDLKVGTGAAAIVGAPVLTGGQVWALGGPAVNIADSSYFFNFKLADGSDAADLGANATTSSDLFLIATQVHTLSDTAAGGNLNVGNVLSDPSITDPTLLTIEGNVNGAGSAQGVNDVLSSAGPTVDGSDEAGAVDVSDQTLGLTNDRLLSLRTGEEASGMSAGNMSKGLGAWGQAFGQHANQSERDGIAGYNSNTYGAAVGIDTHNLGDQNGILGVAFAYGRTNANSDNANSTDTNVDSYQVALYGNWDFQRGYYLNGMGSFGWDNDHRTRHDVGGISGLDARGDYNARQFDAMAEAGKDMIYNGMTLTPNVTAHWVNWDPDSYTETGAGGADLSVNGSTLNRFELGGGVKAGWNFKGSDGSWIKPQLRIGYSYAVTDDQINDTAQFAGGGGAFTVNGANPGRSALDLGASVKYLTVRNWDFTASADFDWRDNYTAEAGFLRAGYKF